MRRALRLSAPSSTRAPLWVWVLLVATLAMRAVFPAGIMAEARGTTIVVGICNSDAKIQIAIPARHDGRQGGDADGKAKASPCAFAGLAQVAIAGPAPLALPLPADTDTLRASHPVAPQATAPPRLLPPATGPPLPA